MKLSINLSECLHPGAVEYIHTISVPLNRAILVQCLLRESAAVLCIVVVLIG